MNYTYDQMSRWAMQFFPLMKYSLNDIKEQEPFYPVDVKGWLTHKADDVAIKEHERGTALYSWHTKEWKQYGLTISPGDITLDTTLSGIGNSKFAQPPDMDGNNHPDWFLDFGGWCNAGTTKEGGQILYDWTQYMEKVYHPLLGLPTSSMPDDPTDTTCSNTDPSPSRFNPDIEHLNGYVEVNLVKNFLADTLRGSGEPLPPEWAVALASEDQTKNIPPNIGDLICLTYYFFYPAYVPPEQHFMEGDWEAVSVFLDVTDTAIPILKYASYSQGYTPGLSPQPLCSQARSRENILPKPPDPNLPAPSEDHPLVYVGWGTHANYFTQYPSEVRTQPIFTSAQVYAASGLAAGTAVVSAVCIAAGGAVGAVAAVIITALIALFSKIFHKNEEPHVNPSFDPPHIGLLPEPHSGNGSQTGGANVGTTTHPPPSGNSPFLLTVISDPAITDGVCPAPPPWWSYVGRWGVCVDDQAVMELTDKAPGWSNGVWRRRPDGYTLTRNNLKALYTLFYPPKHGSPC